LLKHVNGFAFQKTVEAGTGANVFYLMAGQWEILDCLDIEMADNLSMALYEIFDRLRGGSAMF
jgi:hypothetical protein